MANKEKPSKQGNTSFMELFTSQVIGSVIEENKEALDRLCIRLIENVQSAVPQIVVCRKGSGARHYKAGSSLSSTISEIIGNDIEIDNIQTCYEVESPNSPEKDLLKLMEADYRYTTRIACGISKLLAEDVLYNLFWGKKLGDKSLLGLYDGYWVKIDQYIQDEKISNEFGNLVDMPSISHKHEAYIGEYFDNFMKWVDGWHHLLRSAEHVVVYMSDVAMRKIVGSYMQMFPQHQININIRYPFRQIDKGNIELISNAYIGKGDRMFATVPGNLEFAMDVESDWNNVYIDRDKENFNLLNVQVQTSVGVRILKTDAANFCINNGTIRSWGESGCVEV